MLFFEKKEKFPSIIAGLNYNDFNEHFREILSNAQFEMLQNKLHVNSTQYCSFQRVQKLTKTINNGWIATYPDLKHEAIDSLFKYIKYNQDS
ncbi:hypothetical protein GCM10007103_21210 [Salinimicrobium marinum]|uniref:Uncharacterized protein n=1 Tax=Salinimicrobium marinum TaxID=680283 RepID=A0A918SHD0_9FLAO|nr:hypothetical protein GCM10007103_21210 [Salinimicrobium marinum]